MRLSSLLVQLGELSRARWLEVEALYWAKMRCDIALAMRVNYRIADYSMHIRAVEAKICRLADAESMPA